MPTRVDVDVHESPITPQAELSLTLRLLDMMRSDWRVRLVRSLPRHQSVDGAVAWMSRVLQTVRLT